MRTQYTPKLVFSAYRNKPTDMEHHVQLINTLISLGIPYVLSQGIYNGLEERSVIVADTVKNREYVKGFCQYFEQECYLRIDNEGQGTLEYANGTSERLGGIKVIKGEYYNNQGSTYIPSEHVSFTFN